MILDFLLTIIVCCLRSSGTKPTGGMGDRQERSILRRMEYEERHGAEIEAKRAELRFIEDSINSVDDPMERMVLRIRYTGSENAKPMPWRSVAVAIYKDDSDAKMLAIYRLHGRALKSLQSILPWENASE